MSDQEQQELLSSLTSNHLQVPLSSPDRAMLDYPTKLTVAPAAVNRADVDKLRAEGFDDRAVHDICAITAYFAFVNRIADGLGVEMESQQSPADG